MSEHTCDIFCSYKEVCGEEVFNTSGCVIDALEYKAAAEKLWKVIETAGCKGEEVEIRHNGKLFRIREVPQ